MAEEEPNPNGNRSEADHDGYEYNEEGYDTEGYDEEGYDDDGYDRDGYSCDDNDY